MKEESPILDDINSPDDLKNIHHRKLKRLASEIRKLIIGVVSSNGGHLASNLGVVELTIALHRAFNSPVDKIIWDVGHQCYTHKILTGRKESFHTIRKQNGLSGFPKRSESEHDPFNTGHASTSISAGLGILAGLRSQSIEGKVVTVIGDGSLTGGMAFEALNHAGHLKKDLIVILNDNNMSISQNVGALSLYLSRLTTTLIYQTFRRNIDRIVKFIPLIGPPMYEMIYRVKKGIKAVFFKENLFSDLGFEYVGPIDGHNINQLVNVFERVKKIDKPVVIHVSTKKGKGYDFAEGNPTLYHGVSPFSVIDGKIEKKTQLSYTEAFTDAVIEKAHTDKKITAITAAMAEGTGFKNFQHRYPERFYDVGITEEHAVTFAAGLAASGMKPFVSIYSTFMQRTVDQVIHDVALPDLPVTMIIDRAGLVGSDGETHQGIFDISLFRTVPNIKFLAPYDHDDIKKMADYAAASNHPVMIRYPKALCPERNSSDEALVEGRGKFLYKNDSGVLLIGFGGYLDEIVKAGDKLSRKGIKNDIYNMRFLKPVDEKYLISILKSYQKVFLFDDSMETNGMGEYIIMLIHRENVEIKFYHRGIKDFFPEHAGRDELMAANSLDSGSIVSFVSETAGV
jgi:1-deoxy-D-xylulose-5-phosphate synthase